MGKSRRLIANGCIHCGLTIEPTPRVPIKASQHRGHFGITARKAVLRVERAMPLDPYLETGLGISESLFTDTFLCRGCEEQTDRRSSGFVERSFEQWRAHNTAALSEMSRVNFRRGVVTSVTEVDWCQANDDLQLRRVSIQSRQKRNY